MMLHRMLPDCLVRKLVSPYVVVALADDLVREALADRELAGYGPCVFGMLCRPLASLGEIEDRINFFKKLIDSVSAISAENRPGVLLSLPDFCDFDVLNPFSVDVPLLASAMNRVRPIVDMADSLGVAITLECDYEEYLAPTTDFFRQLRTYGKRGVGLSIHAYMHRSEFDIDSLPHDSRIRLSRRGLCRYPAEVALEGQVAMDNRMLKLARQIILKGHRLEFATLKGSLVRRFLGEVVDPLRVNSDMFEVHMLSGQARAPIVTEMVRKGVRVRRYVPFAMQWVDALWEARSILCAHPAALTWAIKDMLKRRMQSGPAARV
jgi:hypothetical protein